ncbi:hypothetical protein AXG93_269s1020 [Marchantia polymorpha subsp. ruderalis]|uniref:Uncharacterized protein n=1 Tax=Marchantia polymorpha subsp. ruderalis TaxID=1480154 RepID=A0A176W0I3_MARPO|nr:hypothetical protein AXG93_269s1020 [Marchantia polymorpha subsp. ruderalis]
MDGPLEEGKEWEDETKTETLDQCLWPSEQPSAPSAKDLRPLGKITSDMPTELEEPAVSSGTVDFDCGEGTLAKEPKTAEFSLADHLSDRIVPLVKYLDGKMMKSVKPELAGSYVELVRSRTKAKVAVAEEVAERVAILTFECATMTVTLQAQEEQLWAKELECAEL